MTFTVRKPRKILVFLGAGASAPFGYPTTKSFLEKLDWNTTGEEKKYLNSIRSLHLAVQDVEHVVEILDLVLELESVSEKGRLSDFLYKYPLTLDFTRKNEKEFRFTPSIDEKVQWKQLIELTKKLRDDIEEITFQQYESKVDQYSNIEREYKRLFSMLKGHSQDKELEVFTTNYDNVIEDYCRRSGISCTVSVLNREANPIIKDAEDRVILTKLHGSLNWLIDKETGDIEFTNTQARVRKDSTRWKSNEYVLFGTKVRLKEAKIYDKLFNRLTEFLLKAEVCIVIGFFSETVTLRRFSMIAYSKIAR